MKNRIKEYMETKTFSNKNVFSVCGSIDRCTSKRVSNELHKINASELFIDLSEVDFLNTSIVGILEDTKHRFKKVYLVNPSSVILEVLDLMGIDKLASVIQHNTSDSTSK